jgi:hypothetical protein
MVFDVLRGYLHVASGLSDITKQRARDLAEIIVVQGMDVSSKSQEQVQTLTEDLTESSRMSREILIGLVRTEVDRTVSRMGFVREDELAAVRQHVNRLESQLQKEHQRATGKASDVVKGTAGSSTYAARSAVGAASKTVSGVAGAMASGAAMVAGSASSVVNPAETGSGSQSSGAEKSVPVSEASNAATGEGPATPTDGSKGVDIDDSGSQETGMTSGKSTTKTPAKKAAAKRTTAKKASAKKQTPIWSCASNRASANKPGANMAATNKASKPNT